ncbi:TRANSMEMBRANE PROTEIN [Salix purpurea]|uniref:TRANSMEMBRANE PROTEIN n=1 Tax=Salix purpurea TaxID=77065 RepID=A0A9Q0VSU5_SALPP|nr:TRANSMEMBRANE PROTEIN [Salix purpurea]
MKSDCFLFPGAIIACSLGIFLTFHWSHSLPSVKAHTCSLRGGIDYFMTSLDVKARSWRQYVYLLQVLLSSSGHWLLLGLFMGSMVSSIFLGAYAGVVVYQESFWFGLCYIVASLAIYDEYSNDILDMPEGSCFPRPKYQKDPTKTTSRTASFSGSTSVRNPLSRGISFNHPMVDLKPLELLDRLFKECQHHGEIFVSEGVITQQDIDDAKSGKGSRVVSIGLPAYCVLQALLRSAKANSVGILLNDNVTEITSTNRPKDTFYEWFLNPFLIIKDQIKAENLSEEEEEYLGRLVLLNRDPVKLRSSNSGPPPEPEQKLAKLDALARRLQGITKSVSRYPTSRRHFDNLVKNLSENLAKKNSDARSSLVIPRSKSAFARMFSQKSFKKKTSFHGSSDHEAESVSIRNVDIV